LHNIPIRCDRYSIRQRAAALGVPLTTLLNESNKTTGRRMHLPDFSNAVAGKDRTDCAEQTLSQVDRILWQLEHPVN
jgi:hypothetical protein